MQTNEILIKGALLHDIGKVLYRANRKVGNHSYAGSDFLTQYLNNTSDKNLLLDCIRYHHHNYIRPTELLNDNLAYIVYEADNIASGMDRRDNEEENPDTYNAKLPLCSIFSVFNGDTINNIQAKYPLIYKDINREFNYPREGISEINSDTYQKLVYNIKSKFLTKNINDMSINELLQFLEDSFAYVPSSTSTKQICDISLYVHSKLTAAIANCMKIYFDEHNITDYKKYCFNNNSSSREFKEGKNYLLISGDLSGIQKFIYTVPSKGALKSLRGRSIYIDLVLENFIDELLDKLNLTRANLLYSGGGHFYILATNTEKTVTILSKLQILFNKWLLENVGTNLYLAVGKKECSANELKTSEAQKNIFAIVNKNIKINKTSHFNNDIDYLTKLFTLPNTQETTTYKECSICHKTVEKLYAYANDEKIACDFCLNLYKLGEAVLAENIAFVISKKTDNKNLVSIPIFSEQNDMYLYPIDIDEISTFRQSIVRLYSKNTLIKEYPLATRLYIADYSAKSDDGVIKTFNDLAKMSYKENQGIKRLGVLRIDVDDLSVAFTSGFVRDNTQDNLRYATLSRYADLSKDMSMFFKVAINKLCMRELTGLTSVNQQAFSLFGISKQTKRDIHIIYSGGDDLCLIGSWDDVLEVAVDIRRAFRQFTNDKLSLCAGMAMFTASYPISKMTEITGLLQEESKQNPNKDSIALFGFDTEYTDDYHVVCKHIYKWQDFEQKVCKEKMQFLFSHLDINNNDKRKITLGKSLIYRLLDLIDLSNNDKLNIARFAYVLGRMQPYNNDKGLLKLYEEFSTTMYKWINNPKDKQELATALNLLIYYLREQKE